MNDTVKRTLNHAEGRLHHRADAHATGSVTVERIDLANRWERVRFARTRVGRWSSRRSVDAPSLLGETYRLDPRNSPALSCAEALGLVARSGGQVVGRMVALRPISSGDSAWFTRLALAGGPEVMAALAQEGARWAARKGAVRWLGPVGLMPGEICGVQVDGFVGRRMGDVPTSPRGMGSTLTRAGFATAFETGVWHLPISERRRVGGRVETANVDLTNLEDDSELDWAELIARLPATTDPVSRLACDPHRLRHELLRPAVQGGVSCALVGGSVAAFGMLRPVCTLTPGLALPGWLVRLRQWKRRSTAAEGQARVWVVAEHEGDEWLAGAVLDALTDRARRLGYGGIVVGPVGMDSHGTITALRDRGARLQGRFQLYAQKIDPRWRLGKKVSVIQDGH